MRLSAGERLGSYEIVALIGSGGMGEVYRARDTRLRREVAVKLLGPAFSDDALTMARFQREGQAIAALSHPNICSIYDIGVHGALQSLDRMKYGPPPAAAVASTSDLEWKRERRPIQLTQTPIPFRPEMEKHVPRAGAATNIVITTDHLIEHPTTIEVVCDGPILTASVHGLDGNRFYQNPMLGVLGDRFRFTFHGPPFDHSLKPEFTVYSKGAVRAIRAGILER